MTKLICALWAQEGFILTLVVPSVNKVDLQALTFVGPIVTRPVQDPLAILSLDNWLYINVQIKDVMKPKQLSIFNYVNCKCKKLQYEKLQVFKTTFMGQSLSLKKVLFTQIVKLFCSHEVEINFILLWLKYEISCEGGPQTMY